MTQTFSLATIGVLHQHAKSHRVLMSSAFVWGFMQGVDSPEDLLTCPLSTTFSGALSGALYTLGAEIVSSLIPMSQGDQFLNWVLWTAIASKVVRYMYLLHKRRRFIVVSSPI